MNRLAKLLIGVSAGALASACSDRDAAVDNNATDDNSVVVVPNDNATANVDCPQDTRCIPENEA